MNPYMRAERVDVASVASVAHHQLSPAPSLSSALASSQRAEPPDPRLVAKLEALATRVEILEKRLKSLSECAVQQFWDGRLHLPAGDVLRVELGQCKLAMDGARFTVIVNGKTVVGSTGAAGASGSPGSGQAGSSLGSMGQSNSSWQSVAQSNSIESPRQQAPGSLIDLGK
jgi:hypothetical protein